MGVMGWTETTTVWSQLLSHQSNVECTISHFIASALFNQWQWRPHYDLVKQSWLLLLLLLLSEETHREGLTAQNHWTGLNWTISIVSISQYYQHSCRRVSRFPRTMRFVGASASQTVAGRMRVRKFIPAGHLPQHIFCPHQHMLGQQKGKDSEMSTRHTDPNSQSLRAQTIFRQHNNNQFRNSHILQ